MTMDLENGTHIHGESASTASLAGEEINENIREKNTSVQKNENKFCLFFKNTLDENNTEDKRLGYSKKNRFIIAGMCLIIVILTYITISESGNYKLNHKIKGITNISTGVKNWSSVVVIVPFFLIHFFLSQPNFQAMVQKLYPKFNQKFEKVLEGGPNSPIFVLKFWGV